MDNTPKVTMVKQNTTFTATGDVVRTFLVTYTIGDHGPFSLTVPAAEFKAPHVRELMQATADTIGQLTAGV